ncbi:MAG TPA: hypothetical protein VF559_08855 [Caulobacteraceae bacterium]|jgi:hypothetical protein
MHDLGEALLNTVAAMSAASFGYFGVTLKEDPARAAKPEPAVVRRVPAPAAPRQAVAVRRPSPAAAEPCPDEVLVKT